MNNNLYEKNYSQFIEPIYGSLRDSRLDNILTENYKLNHEYSIDFNERVDMTSYEVYSIDPDGCEDADDAFSIYYQNDELYLAIHIADPTEYIKLNSKLWNDIEERTTTKYPSNRNPIHMIPDFILKISSLKGDNELKKAISIITKINKDSFRPTGEIKLIFSKILVKSTNSFSYKEASEIDSTKLNQFKIGLSISKSLQEMRSKVTKGVILNELSIAYPKYNNDIPYLYQDSDNEKLMKQMIAEFAILANSFVGKYLESTKLIQKGIFRTCEAKDWLNNTSDNITGEEMIQQIVTNGITADYTSIVTSHDLVGMPEYCHFTSPIRRLADCVCHYLLIYIYFKENGYNEYQVPFNTNELDILSSKCLKVAKKDKKNQYIDIKFRLLQVMNNMIYQKGSVILEYYITGYTGLFLNIIICKIDNFKVYMSYTLKIRNYDKEINKDEHKLITCTKVNCFTNYDQNCIPELDSYLIVH